MGKKNKKLTIRSDLSVPLLSFVGGAVAGSLLTLLFDPNQGAHRRSRIAGKARAFSKDSVHHTRKVVRNVSNHIQGIFATVTHFNQRWASVDDEKLNQRVRSHLGHHIDHAHSIETHVQDGVVTVTGPALSTAVGEILSCIKAVPGVKRVIDDLDVQPSAEQVSKARGNANPYLQ